MDILIMSADSDNKKNQTPALLGPSESDAGIIPAVHSSGGWMNNSQTRRVEHSLTTNELISLSALIAYVASQTQQSEFRVERDVSDRFNVANVKCLPAELYDAAMRYLVDRVPAAA
jgi:hypothetical protein